MNPPDGWGVNFIVNTGGFFGAAVLPILMGIYFDRYGDALAITALYRNGFLIMFAAVCIAMIAVLLVRETGCVNVWKKENALDR